jgi:dipeptidyl aminopeptidase/acylaminoacyl peptidase
MKILTSLVCFMMTIAGLSSWAPAAEPPLLDRQLFFGNPTISGGQLSPDGKMISFLKETNGIMNIWVKAFDESFENARPLTDSPRPLYGYFWSEDGKYVLYVKDKDGDENINVFAVDPHEKVEKGAIPESRNLTPMDEVAAQIAHISQKNPDLMWVGLNNRDKAWHDLYQLRISTGDMKLVYENTDRITGYEFDWDDNLRLLSRTDEKGTTTLLRKEGDSLDPIYETLVTENGGVLGWTPDNSRFYMSTNKGDLDLSTVYLMDPKTRKMELFESDPEKRVDFGGLQLDENTRKVISTSYLDDRTRYYWKDDTWKANYEFLKAKFPGREIAFQSSTKDYSKFLIAITGDRYASEAWFFDAKTKQLIHQYTPRPELKAVEEHLSPMTAVRYKSSDGLEIPGYLTIPAGREAKNLPLIVLVHGGPKGPRDVWGYDPEVQFLANRGYAVLQPNFRASGGYGKKFLNAGDGQWGLLMQDDITWGVKHLIEKGIADPNKIGIAGGSYGGYATLAGLTFTPDLYACGVDIVGPSNIFTLLESIPAYWESGRAFLYGMVGDPESEEGKQRIREASPLFSATKIEKPLLIIQGANDPRVKQAEADQIVIALRDRGHDVAYLLADDEGHGFAKPVNQMAMYAEVERFLASKLGGRYQTEMPSDVAKRLGELRVDISKVTYNDPKQMKVSESLPPVKTLPKEGMEAWDVTLSVQGQTIPMTSQRSVRRDGDNWVIEDRMKTPFGSAVDVSIYTASLAPLSRSVEQGGQKIELTYRDKKAEIKANGTTTSLEYNGAILDLGGGRDAIIAGIDWREGDSLGLSVVNLEQKKIATQQLKCEGNETLDGVSCVKVTLTDAENMADKTTFWIDSKTRKIVRVEAVVPALGNAKMTMTPKTQ